MAETPASAGGRGGRFSPGIYGQLHALTITDCPLTGLSRFGAQIVSRQSSVVNRQSSMSTFTIYPAIDLRDGQVVRLKQGDPNQQTTYSSDPVEIARKWAAAGSAWLHVVNLDGAFGAAEASQANRAALNAIAAAVPLKVQFGGGVRSLDDVRAALDAGASRVVIGTAAIEQPELVAEVLRLHGPQRLVVGLDSKDGMIVTRGWQHTTPLPAIEVGERMRAMGVLHALYTEVGRDGMLSGVAAELTAALAQITGLQVMASGGVKDMKDIHELLLYAPRGVAGVIVGRSLYEGTLDLGEALAAAAA
jgi:phosphoribosylformimino-5-aminoimidazole carboxamide ribotide isomerase